MKHSKLLLFLLISLVMILVTACGSGAAPQIESVSADELAAGEHMADDDHHESAAHNDAGMAHIHAEAPHEYEDMTNPVAGDLKAIEAGEETFNTLCATCHGLEGKGDGPGAEGLDPQPADLSDGTMLSTLSDGYLFWRVSEGGAIEPFNSAMPAWKDSLTEEQRWQVISFLRTLSDGHGDDDHGHEEEAEHHEEEVEHHEESNNHEAADDHDS